MINLMEPPQSAAENLKLVSSYPEISRVLNGIQDNQKLIEKQF